MENVDRENLSIDQAAKNRVTGKTRWCKSSGDGVEEKRGKKTAVQEHMNTWWCCENQQAALSALILDCHRGTCVHYCHLFDRGTPRDRLNTPPPIGGTDYRLGLPFKLPQKTSFVLRIISRQGNQEKMRIGITPYARFFLPCLRCAIRIFFLPLRL